MIPEITVQLYSVRQLAAADYEKTLRAIADIGFGNVEPAGFPGSTPAQAAKLFKELGLKAPSCHGPLPIGEKRNEILETALLLGHKYLITGCPPKFQEHYTSADSVKAMTELYCQAADFVAPHGLQVGYHNHDWDLKDVDGKPGYRYFLENTPDTILWEADLFWVARAGLDPVKFVKEIGPRGKVLHYKDGAVNTKDTFKEAVTSSGRVMVSDASPFLPAGAGQVNLIGAAKAAAYVEYAAVELDSYVGDMMEAVRESYAYLTKNRLARGRK